MTHTDNFQFLPTDIVSMIKDRKALDDETLLTLYREFNACERLLTIEIFYYREHLARRASFSTVNYSKTPEHIYGILPPLETTLELSCFDTEPMKSEADITSEAEKLLALL